MTTANTSLMLIPDAPDTIKPVDSANPEPANHPDHVFREKFVAACRQYDLDLKKIEQAHRQDSNNVASAVTVLTRLTVQEPRMIDQLQLHQFQKVAAHDISLKLSELKQKVGETRDRAISEAYAEWLTCQEAATANGQKNEGGCPQKSKIEEAETE